MTIDMSNNRVPYGLLTDEEKAALHEHEQAGGKFEYWTGVMWYGAQPHPTLTRRIYRTVPLPKTQDVIAWEKLPAWVEWVARDGDDGHVHGHQYEPCRGNTAIWFGYCGRRLRIDDFPGIVVQIGTVGWKDSKQRRPK
jgi:hypothetical protein